MSHYSIRHVLLGATAIYATAIVAAVPAQAQVKTFDVAAQAAATGIPEFARQADIQILVAQSVVADKQTKAVSGQMTTEEGLRRLLEGTGLRVTSNDGRTITLAAVQGASTKGELDAGQDLAERASVEPEPEEIVVTGSHIRGAGKPVGGQLITIDREEINRAGFSTVRDITEKLPQNFGGGATGERQINMAQAANISQGATINLRGLGNVATLVLLNGRRLPVGGDTGQATDISVIPLSILDRIEVLPDGASATYGSDAVAGVVNFITRKNFSGMETSARWGTAKNGTPDQIQFGQLIGRSWDTGNFMAAYEYFQRDNLASIDRSFADTYDLRKHGGRDYRIIFSNPGNIINPTTGEVLYALPAGQTGRDLTVGQLLPANSVNLFDLAPFIDLLPKEKRHSVYLSLDQGMSEATSLFAEARFTRREAWLRQIPHYMTLTVPSTNPFYVDVFGDGQSVSVAYALTAEGGILQNNSTTHSYGGSLGLRLGHSTGWNTEIATSYSQEDVNHILNGFLDFAKLESALNQTDPKLAFNPFGEGANTDSKVISEIITNRKIRDITAHTVQAQVVTSGKLFSMRGNDARMAIGIDLRKEVFDRALYVTPQQNKYLVRKVGAVFGEINLPFVNGGSELPGLYQFIISVSARHERYDDTIVHPTKRSPDTQSTTNPRFGIIWSPIRPLSIKATYGTSFRAPSLSALSDPTSVRTGLTVDPLSSTGRAYILAISGSQPNLKHETADTWTLGADLALPIKGAPHFSVNYFNINFRDQISTPIVDLTNPLLAPLIVRNPTLSQVQAACALAVGGDNRLGPDDCTTPGLVQAIADVRTANYSATQIDGLDFTAEANLDLAKAGTFGLRLSGTYLFNYKQAILPNSPLVSNLNRPLNPIDFRARLNATWNPSSKLAFSSYVNYTSDYWDPVQRRKVASWTTVDASLSYEIKALWQRLPADSLTAQFNVSNLFNKLPPFYEYGNIGSAYDPANADPLGRQIALTVTARW